MWLPFLFACSLAGSFAIQYEDVCYGRTYRFPFDYSPPVFQGKIYFTPRKGGSRRLVYDNGEANDPRLKANPHLSLQDLREQDEGTFSAPFGDIFYDIVVLKILECAEDIHREYNDLYRFTIPDNVDILEFTPMGKPDQTMVVWNRTQPTTTAGRGRPEEYYWEISDLTQKDSGYYNLRKKSNTLDSRKKLTVTEHKENYKPKEDTAFFIQYPSIIAPWHITFKPNGPGHPLKLMVAGKWREDIDEYDRLHFGHRLQPKMYGLQIFPVESRDSGVYEIRDKDDQLMFVAHVKVEEAHVPTYVYIICFVAIIAVVALCCCCMRRCCCKKDAAKTNASQTAAAATPAVYYHGPIQPAGTSYSAAPPAAAYSYQPVNPARAATPTPAGAPSYQHYNTVSASGPTPDSSGPPVYNSVVIHPSPLHPEAAVSGGNDSAPAPTLGFDCLSSDPGPRFELKGMNFPSALSSDSTVSDVYTSDKLNFM